MNTIATQPQPASLENQPEQLWAYYRVQVPADSLNVKTREPVPHCKCGQILWPDVFMGDVKSDEQLYAFIRSHAERTVAVVGHGTFGQDRFVWIGTIEQFIETWMGD